MAKSKEDIIWDIKNGELEAVQEAFPSGSQNINLEIKGRFPLHYAADFGQDKVLEYLISLGANLNQPDKHGITPLLAAIWEGHTKCVKLLLEKGASKSGKTPDGQSYLEAAEKDEIRALLS